MEKFFLTFFYLGNIKIAPGTFGTIAGLIPAFFILKYLGSLTLFLTSILIFVISIKMIDNYEIKTKTHDDKHIVIDEVVGIFLALSICGDNIFTFLLSFFLFRFFDIKKPSIIGKIDKNIKGGLGVMLDDVLAGLFAGLSCSIIYGIMIKLNISFLNTNLKDLF